MYKLKFEPKDRDYSITIRVNSGLQFYHTIKALGLQCGKQKTCIKIYEQLISGERNSAYGWRIV